MSAVSQRSSAPLRAGPIRVAVADDSVVVRGLLRRWLGELPDVAVVGAYCNGAEAVRQCAEAKPDVLLLDIEMPEMDGLTALPKILAASPGTRVLIISSHSIRGADITLRCLVRGATDYLAKPSSMSALSTSLDFRVRLAELIRAAATAPRREPGARPLPVVRPLARSREAMALVTGPAAPVVPLNHPVRSPSRARPEIIVVGASTGGPKAIIDYLFACGPALGDVPVLVAQHMPATFTMLFADYLRRHAGFDAVEVGGGETLVPGRIHICRGGGHMAVRRAGRTFCVESAAGQPDWRWKPSINLLFESAAGAAGAGMLGILLTGMGDDGALGARSVADAGGSIYVQDEASCVVWGMPGAALRTGATCGAFPVDELARFTRILIGRSAS